MKQLNLNQLCLIGEDELAEEENMLVNAMQSSPISHLERLVLMGNPSLFANAESSGYIVEFIQR